MKLSPEKLISASSGMSASLFKSSFLEMVGIRSFVMSGLQGLFVGKQKATTDAPDTYTA